MKKLFKKLHLPIVLMLILSILLSGCVMSLTCISHIDRDRNGECDNCGIAMEVPREDIENVLGSFLNVFPRFPNLRYVSLSSRFGGEL